MSVIPEPAAALLHGRVLRKLLAKADVEHGVNVASGKGVGARLEICVTVVRHENNNRCLYRSAQGLPLDLLGTQPIDNRKRHQHDADRKEQDVRRHGVEALPDGGHMCFQARRVRMRKIIDLVTPYLSAAAPCEVWLARMARTLALFNFAPG